MNESIGSRTVGRGRRPIISSRYTLSHSFRLSLTITAPHSPWHPQVSGGQNVMGRNECPPIGRKYLNEDFQLVVEVSY
jgi:hypothetical protein